jgi:hypothetical protein
MKQRLLLLTMMLFISIANAQHTWDFGNDTTNWPVVASAPTVDFVRDGLNCVAGGSAFGQITANAATFSTFGSDNFTAVDRFNTGGASTITSGNPALPTKRYLSFPVTGSCTVKLWMGATALGRTGSISNGVTILGSYTTAGTTPFPGVITVNYVGAATTLYVYCDASIWFYKLSWTPAGAASPTLTPDTTSNDVDNNLDISFTNDPTWFAAISSVKIGATTLAAGTDYVLTAGNLQLLHTGPNAGLVNVAGSVSVTINSAGYAPANVTQVINAGAPTAANSTVSISPALDNNVTSTITVIAKDQYNNLVSGYAFKFDITRTNTNATTNESYTVNGVPYTTNATGVSIPVTNVSGVATFAATLPATINVNDGVSIQVKLANGTTNVGSAFTYINTLIAQTITFAPLAPVAFGSGNFNLTASASSGLAVSYVSSDPLVATVSGSTVTIVGVGTTSITASQDGNSTYDSAVPVSRDLVINCGSTSTNTTTITACGSYTWANNGQTYTTSGVYTGTTTNCVTQSLNLTISGSTNVTNVTACGSYTWANNGQTYTVSGVYNGTTTACVLEQLNLTINSTIDYFVDGDNDGVGAGGVVALCSATAPAGYSAVGTDCNDADILVWRSATLYKDVDADGYTDLAELNVCYGATVPAGYFEVPSSPSKVWNFSNTAIWPLSGGIGATDIVTDQLGIYPLLLTPGTVNMGAITANVTTFPATATTAAFGPTVNRFQLNGGGSTTTNKPQQRYAYFDVSGSCRVLVWFKTGGATLRTMFVTDGTNVIGSLGSTSSTDFLVLKANYTGGATRLYIYGDQACNLYKIEVTGATITTPAITAAPTLNFVADTTLNDVDHDIDITFTDNPTWRAAVYAIRIATTTLVPGTDYDLTAGHLILKPSGGNAALTTPGDKKINLLATNYSSSSTGLTQTILAGVPATINLKLYVEGYYNPGTGLMRPVKLNQGVGVSTTDVETITIELHSASAPYATVRSATTVLQTNGNAVCNLPAGTPSASYYLVVKTSNAIETWSATPQAVGGTTSYDFSNDAAKAYGSNMVNLNPGVFGLFSGDIDIAHDGNIDTIDYPVWENDSNNFESGVFRTDLNGDGNVDTIDYPIWELNSNNFVSVVKP